MGIYSVLVHVCTFGSMVRFGQEEKDQHLVSFGWYLCLLLLSSFLCLPQIFSSGGPCVSLVLIFFP